MIGLLGLYVAGCSFVWNALSVYVFAYNEKEVDAMAELEGDFVLLEDDDIFSSYENGELEYVSDSEMMSAEEILSENTIEELDAKEDDMELSREDWRLVLINKQHSIPEDYEFTLGSINTVKGTMRCDERIIPDLLKMLQAAKDDGVNLQICSPYRDMNRQVYLFDRKINAYMKQGMSYMDAYSLTAQAVTVPGASEHQIGLALDIVSDKYSYLNEGFGDTEAGKWLAEHSCEYGFILRYPKGKEYITGIEYEPWHFRYVGREAAMIITSEDLTLEEFVDSLEEWR
ncbi:MAG: D-alanyl-D-alanine carboxypeptidase family protein [Lachnospiraceae bacterium]|nr:D-alanyl-D-alanine carboxypeptidase family protein [Lachnospiraceae bacterium]